MEVIRSNKGCEKLCRDGYTYTKKKASNSIVRWECSQRGSKKCKGSVTTNTTISEVKSTTHSHDGDHFAVEALKFRAEIKSSVEVNRGQAGQIIADKLISHPVEVRCKLGKIDTLKRTVRRVKRANAPKEPSSVQDIPHPLPEEYTTTGGANASEFLIYDNNSDTERILMYSSATGLKSLGEAETWFMDGTHGTTPTQFSQLFVIRVPLADSSVSAVYAFLPSKSQTAYEECLSALLDVCLLKNIRPNPTHVVADFEVGIHNAVKSVLGEQVHIQGCFYHLTQSTWRKLQSEGLQTVYSADDDVKHFCGKLDGLAFLPVDDVSEGRSVLREETPECLSSVVDYFDTTYVTGGFRSVRANNGHLRFRRTPARFPADTWNVHKATIDDRHRTNNICESWNNGFRHLVGHDNPSLWTVINCLQKDNALVEMEVERTHRGEPSSKRVHKQSAYLQKKLKKLCQQYVNGERPIPEFLDAVGHCIRLV